MKKILLNLELKWHTFKVSYNHALLAGCLDHQLKVKLRQKIKYHEMKLMNRLNGNVPY
ncbi:hypothetical protein HP456_19950 [Bacillus haikouensis]|uniref:hypothetical protein n=1 Tax=Bacillus haikouensis TaxID=1510468 RepID=UPI0015581D21|nr:hypothetical protein [Bacillus haikouensis]NQD68184.1 hypothetical protein [Bacillus haikouensis]